MSNKITIIYKAFHSFVILLFLDVLHIKRNNTKIKEMKDLLSAALKRDLDNDIQENILSIISNHYTIRKITYSVINMVNTRNCIEVVIEVKCYDYELKKNSTGYFSLEYLYVPDTKEYLIVGRHSRSMSVETKTAARIPYGGWYKDNGQIKNENDYYNKQEKGNGYDEKESCN